MTTPTPEALRFYIGLHVPAHAKHFSRACISINRVRGRKSPVICDVVLLDSGAFTEISTYGRYRHSVRDYALEVRRLCGLMNLDAVVAQDYMCEPFIIEKTGLSVPRHQALTIDRYDELMEYGLSVHVMPVLQGYDPSEYVEHLRAYRNRLPESAWVGVGSVCKRNARPESISRILQAIKRERPDLRLHGFGVKLTALRHPAVRELLYSADSMAWSFAARRQGRNQNCWKEAAAFLSAIDVPHSYQPWQQEMGI